ncbi:ASCH domain-containing protein [Clostridium tunisiense]|uniref:ASCH domain-containing protein n=1 Tax=Clostridium tunisiense TaxID=219748 RepID=UPI00031D2646|nr:ASCH domain-containing protein [Clostridium tunisiense]
MGKEHISVKKMWEDYLTLIGESLESTNKSYTSWYFCDNERSANNLAELVREGTKRGTTGLYDLYKIDNEELPLVDSYSVITNWNGIAQCIIRTKKVTILPFKDVNEELANIEGEGDKSLRYWKKVHMDFFTRELKEFDMYFSQDMSVVFEEFEVVYKQIFDAEHS